MGHTFLLCKNCTIIVCTKLEWFTELCWIAYIKLSDSLLPQCGINGLYTPLDGLPSAVPRVKNPSSRVYPLHIGSTPNTYTTNSIDSTTNSVDSTTNSVDSTTNSVDSTTNSINCAKNVVNSSKNTINSAKCSTVGTSTLVGLLPKTTSTSYTKFVARCNNSEIYSGKLKSRPNGQRGQHVCTAVFV